MKARILVVAMLLVAAALTGGAARNSGMAEPPAWPTQVCTDGSMTAMVLELSQVRLDGELKCGVEDPPGKWVIARYFEGIPFGEISELRDYAATSPTPFSITKDVIWDGTGYLCVLTDPKTRLACVKVKSRPFLVFSVEPVPVDHPGVTLPIRNSKEITPATCGTCW